MADAELQMLFKARDEASGVLSKLKSGLGDVAKIAAGFVIGKGLTELPGLLKGMTDAASNLAESQSKVNVVFGDKAGGITAWAANSAKAFGQSKQAALEAVGTYGNLFQAFGVGQGKAADMSKSLVELAADLASFNNTSVDDALLALRSGLSGETEPLKRYGIAISDARMRTELAAQGFKNLGSTLTPLQKTTAAYALIMKDSSLAQGDFARTADGLANRQRILAATAADLKARWGDKLLPVVVNVAGVLLDKGVPAFEKFAAAAERAVSELATRADTARAAAAPFIESIERLKRLFEGGLAGNKFGGEFSQLETAAIQVGQFFRTTLIPAFADAKYAAHLFMLALQGGSAGGNLSDFQLKMLALGKTVRETWDNEIKPALRAFAQIVVEVVKQVNDNWATIGPIFAFAFDFVKTRIEGFVQTIHGVVQVVSGVIQLIDDLFHGRWREAWDDLKLIANGVLDILIGNIKYQFGNIPEVLLENLAKLPGIFADMGRKALGAASVAGWNLGKGLINALLAVIEWGINKAIGGLNYLIRKFNEAGAFGVDLNPITIGTVDPVSLPRLAQGARNFLGGLAVVGERGPELVALPRGSNVYSNTESRQIARGDVHIHLHGDVYGFNDFRRRVAQAFRDEKLAGGFSGVI